MLSVEQINQLAPDAASLKAGRDQAKPSKWLSPGRRGELVWGQIQGSGKAPYQTVIDLAGPAYNCTCPSRKFPCKHSLGLLFVAAETGVQDTEAPDWVSEWSSKRAATAEKKAAKEQASAETETPEQAAEKEASATRRAARRDGLMAEGLAQTQIWLEDLMGQGLAWAQTQPSKFWLDQIARLTNAQLPGVARLIEDCFAAANSGEGWAGRLLGELSRLHLLCRAWTRIDQLDAEKAADLRATLGQSQSQDALLTGEGMRGTWQVLVRIYEERDKLKTYRHWLWCHETGRITQVFEFAAGSQPLDTSLPPGLVFDGELVFYPGVSPQRALIKHRAPSSTPMRILAPKQGTQLQPAAGRASAMWTVLPWTRQIPMLFTAIPRADLGGFVDDTGSFLSWAKSFPNAWLLMALSGGRPLHVFGELQTSGFVPLSATAMDSQRMWIQRFER